MSSLIIVAAFVGIVFLGFFISLSGIAGKKAVFLFEEIYFSSADLKKAITRVDGFIYESLYQSGVQEKDVFFLNVQTRHRNGHVWDFSDMRIQCPDQGFASRLKRTLKLGLDKLGSDVGIKSESGSKGGIVCHVSINGFATHRLLLDVNGREPTRREARPRLAIIIDDLGYDAEMDFSFLKLDLPLSLSVLPFGPATRTMVERAHEYGFELVLHLPMEPKHYPSVKPGPGGLFLSMNEKTILKVLHEDLNQVRGAKGVNNHMGSLFTEDREKMRIVLKELKKLNLFFIDSRTTKDTVCLEIAREIGLLADRRRVFLDHNLDPTAMKIQMERLLNMAKHRGSAIGIGHPYKETLKLLQDYAPRLKKEFQIVPLSELVS